ncbi:MAG TPA: medium chain dehydrogenase/reductase family protein [Acidimicrobiia bacterium]|nr:medium chain dehydrogenase/reductase family protein [Acidimicrobiia bacterium]
MTDVKAMVLVEPRRLTASALPHRSIESGGWLAVEATGLSGLEVQAWRGDNGNLIYPLIPGSQIVGRIASRGDGTLPEVGTRVVVEPLIRCGECAPCVGGVSSCTSRRPLNMYGQLPSTEGPGLWGGLAERVYLDPRAVVHPVTDDIQAEVATFAHPLASGFTWVNQLAGLQPGESVLILGPGPRGLSCLIAAQAAGAGWIGISGLDHDADRLELAERLGADLTVNVDVDDLGVAVAGSLGTRPDVVVDVTSNDPEAIYTGFDLVRSGGRVILASTKGNRPLQALFSDIIVAKELSIRGALGASGAAYEWACRQLECDPRIDDMVSHQFPLDESNRAIQATAGLLGHDELISVAVTF